MNKEKLLEKGICHKMGDYSQSNLEKELEKTYDEINKLNILAEHYEILINEWKLNNIISNINNIEEDINE